jgi:hypothetical protein
MKKFFKKRFDEETTPESKLFFTGGFKNKYYLHNDVINIARFLSIILPRKLEWKKDNPHILVDRIEILSDGIFNDNDLVDIAAFGYTRGGTFKTRNKLTIVGLGKKQAKELKTLEDPCPPLEKKVEQTKTEDDFLKGTDTEKDEKEKKKPNHSRTLELDQRMLYAPQSNVGVLTFDETGGYVTIPDKFVIFTKQDNEDQETTTNEGVKMMRELQRSKFKLDTQVDEQEVELVAGVKVKEKPMKKEFISFQSSLRSVAEMAEKVSGFHGVTAKNSKVVNLYDKIYSEDTSREFSQIMDCSKFVPAELLPRSEYATKSRFRFITVGYG